MAMTAARRGGTSLAATVVVAVLALPPAALAEPERPCGPLAVEPISEDAVGAGAVDLTLDPPAFAGGPFDMDGDDEPDALTWTDGTTLVVERGDGTLTLTSVPPDPPYPGFPAQHSRSVTAADLDGDGRDELIITRQYVAGFRQRETYDSHIVRGTTPAVSTPLADVSIAFHGDVVHDIDDDGLPDLWLQGWTTIEMPFPPDRWVSGAGALAGDDPSTLSGTAARLGAFADLDLDGATDHVVIGNADGTVAPAVQFASGDEAAIPATAASTTSPLIIATAVRSDVAHLVRFSGETTRTWEVMGATCAEPWMRAATGWLLGRAPLPADYIGFGPLDAPPAPLRLARSVALVRSQTARGHQVDQAFAWFLGRPADPVGRAWWVSRLRSGARTQERMFAELLGSSERFRRSGSTAAGWVDATYPLVLGRAPDPSGRAYWIRQVAQLGTGRTAARLLAETRARWFQADRHLGLADGFGDDVPAEVRDGARAFAAAGSLDATLAWAAARPEHYLRANQPPS